MEILCLLSLSEGREIVMGVLLLPIANLNTKQTW